MKVDVWFTDFASGAVVNTIKNSAYTGPLEKSELPTTEMWANYVFLDTDERRRFATSVHEYLIEQLQHQNSQVSLTNSIRLVLNHPVKELIWCAPVGEGNLGTQDG